MPFSDLRRKEWVAVVVAAGLAFSSWATQRSYTDAQREVAQTTRVRRELTLFSRDCLLAESGQRGFLLTGREAYLEEFTRGTDSMPGRLKALEAATTSGRLSTHCVKELAHQAAAKLAELNETISAVRQKKKDMAYSVVDSDRGKASMEHIDRAVDSCTAELDMQLEDQEGRVMWLFRVCLTVLVLTGVALAVASITAWQAYTRRRGDVP